MDHWSLNQELVSVYSDKTQVAWSKYRDFDYYDDFEKVLASKIDEASKNKDKKAFDDLTDVYFSYRAVKSGAEITWIDDECKNPC